MDKDVYSLVVSVALLVLLGYSWFVGKDGTITTAIIGMIGTIAGATLGVKLTRGE